MSQHESVWLATASREGHPPLGTDIDVDVAVVGGGITGLTTALLLAREGQRVALVEARRLGAGTTGGTTGKVTSQHSLTYDALVRDHGEHKARLYAEANQAAIETVIRLAQESQVDCEVVRAPAYLYALDESSREDVDAEHRAAVGLGLPASLTTEIDLPFPVEVALRFDDQVLFHAGRYVEALSRSLTEAGGSIFEGTRAGRVTERDGRAVVETDRGTIRAGSAVVATLLPIVDEGGFFARTRPTRAYGIAVRLGEEAPSGMHISAGSPSRSTRPWLIEGERRGLIVVGEDHPTGEGDASPARWGELERWAREHFAVESIDYRWSAQDFYPTDGVPYVGRSPLMEHTYVACGFKKWGLSNGTAAAEILTDVILGRENPWLEVFDSTRIGDAKTIAKLVGDNMHVGRRMVADRLGRLTAESAADLKPGEGGIVRLDGEAVGAYRDRGGALHAVSATCTHLGCTVKWNSAERSWDCPCHGSRFDHEGAVLDGPAVRPLPQIEFDPE